VSLQEKLTELATELGVPGAVAGVVHGDTTEVAVFGVTNVDHPLPVTEQTLFQFGSTGKTYTATALMVLAEQGLVDLNAPVRTYVPELTLKDEDVAAKVTVLQLLNHTAGWSGDVIPETGDGDDAVQRAVDKMVELDQVSPLGKSVSYNNASLVLAGHVIAKVTGKTYEQAVRDLVLEPLGMKDTYGFAKEIMTLSFSAGHNRTDGVVHTVRPWALPRCGAPAGGWTATIGDQLTWARFHLGLTDSTLLSDEARKSMTQPTAFMPGSALGDAVGISWLLTDQNGTLLVGHGGTTHGQHSDFVMVPEAGFGFACMTNCGPTGPELYTKLRAWALETYLGLKTEEPELADVTAEELAAYAGSYESAVADLELVVEDLRLVASITITDTTLMPEGEDPKQPAIPLAITAGEPDRYTVPEGEGRGMKGYFTRGDDGSVTGINLGGRHMTKVG
jgi:CubicO group peptidase (beta-lactamase class C family)